MPLWLSDIQCPTIVGQFTSTSKHYVTSEGCLLKTLHGRFTHPFMRRLHHYSLTDGSTNTKRLQSIYRIQLPVWLSSAICCKPLLCFFCSLCGDPIYLPHVPAAFWFPKKTLNALSVCTTSSAKFKSQRRLTSYLVAEFLPRVSMKFPLVCLSVTLCSGVDKLQNLQ